MNRAIAHLDSMRATENKSSNSSLSNSLQPESSRHNFKALVDFELVVVHSHPFKTTTKKYWIRKKC